MPPPTERSTRPTPEPLDVDAVTVVTVGTAMWGVALLALLPFAGRLADDGHGWWVWMCVAGVLLGLLGIRYCRRRRDAIRRGRPAS